MTGTTMLDEISNVKRWTAPGASIRDAIAALIARYAAPRTRSAALDRLRQTVQSRMLAAGLARRDVMLLAHFEYDHPRECLAGLERRATFLVRMGLLERDPTARRMLRPTDLGQDVVELYRRGGWIDR